MHMIVKGTITAVSQTTAAPNNVNKKVIFKTCVPFTNCISRINNAQVDDAHEIDVVMLIYNFIEYSETYSKCSAILWQYCREKLAVDGKGEIVDLTVANSITDIFFKLKKRLKKR